MSAMSVTAQWLAMCLVLITIACCERSSCSESKMTTLAMAAVTRSWIGVVHEDDVNSWQGSVCTGKVEHHAVEPAAF